MTAISGAERDVLAPADGARVVGLERESLVAAASELLMDRDAHRAMSEPRQVFADLRPRSRRADRPELPANVGRRPILEPR